MWKKLAVAVLVVWGGYAWWSGRPVTQAPRVIVSTVPMQENVSDAHPFDFKGYRITPLAKFSLEARVLAREDYRFGREADLSPTDLALGWGRMSDSAVLEKIDISQSNRFYYLRVDEFPIPQQEIETSSANMHFIPADKSAERDLKKVRKGSIVKVRGYLVRVDANDGWRWVSSLTRNDTGNGACELIWVESVTIL